MTYGSAGVGSISHFACVILLSALKQNITHVPYRGVAPAMNDLMGGHIDFMCDQSTTALAQVAGGKIKAIAVLRISSCRSCRMSPPRQAPAMATSTSVHGTPSSRPRARRRRSSSASTMRCALAVADPSLRRQMEAVGVDLPDARSTLTPARCRELIALGLERDVPALRARGEYLD